MTLWLFNSLVALCRLKEGREVWTNVVARGGKVGRPPLGGTGSSERQGTLAGGSEAGERRTDCPRRPQKSAPGPSFSFQSWSWLPIHGTPLCTASREGRGRQTKGRHWREAVIRLIHSFTPLVFYSFAHSFTHSVIHSSLRKVLPKHPLERGREQSWKGVESRAGSSCVSGSKQCLGRGRGLTVGGGGGWARIPF